MDLSIPDSYEDDQPASKIKSLSSTLTRPGSPIQISMEMEKKNRRKKVPRLNRAAAKPTTMQTTPAGMRTAPPGWHEGQAVQNTQSARTSTRGEWTVAKEGYTRQPMTEEYLWDLLTFYHEPEEVLTRSRQEILDTYMRTEGLIRKVFLLGAVSGLSVVNQRT
jgi:hypothetical protein